MNPKTVILLICIALVAIILLQNMEAVSIQLLFWSLTAPLLILLLAALFVGLLVGWFSHLAYSRGKYKRELHP